jgi:hypothetical protein
MKTLKYFVMISVLLLASPVVNAEKIYESVDSKGSVEFSDQPTRDSKQIDVEPNVVHFSPVKETAPAVVENVNAKQMNMERGDNTVVPEVGSIRQREEADRLRRERARNNASSEGVRAREMKRSSGARSAEGAGARIGGGHHVGGRH